MAQEGCSAIWMSSPSRPVLGHIQIINGDNDPPYPCMLVDFSHIAQDAIWDRNTVALMEWGIRHPDGRVFGAVFLKNKDQPRVF